MGDVRIKSMLNIHERRKKMKAIDVHWLLLLRPPQDWSWTRRQCASLRQTWDEAQARRWDKVGIPRADWRIKLTSRNSPSEQSRK